MTFFSTKERDKLRRLLPKRLISFLRKLFYPEKIYILEEQLAGLFQTHYATLASYDSDQKSLLRNAEFKIYSKYGNDGLLLYIFSKLGVKNHSFIEIGIENGRECNTANLALNFGWHGLMVEANDEWAESARDFFAGKLWQKSQNVKVATCFITAENINELFKKEGFNGEVDLFSLDIDGNDYWVWNAVDAIRPRVVVLEYNSAFGDRPLTIKYNPEHHYQSSRKHPLYFGASLSAMTKLSKAKGYILIGCDSHGHDAFFVRQDIAQDKFKEILPKEAFYPNPYPLREIGPIEKQFEQIKDFEFQQI